MKKIFTVILTNFVLLAPLAVSADDYDASEILAKRGEGVVTQTDMYARIEKIPAGSRFAAVRDRNRLRDLINTLLLRSQLAADAREAGFDQEQVMIDRMRLAADAELAEAWVNRYIEMQPAADFEALALEYYQLNQKEMLSPETIDVSHILISSAERDDEDAKSLAEDIHAQIMADPASFDELVMQHSDDPSATSNKGKFTRVKRGDMVGPFEKAAFELGEGEISAPVKTRYGYHIIRLDAHHAPRMRTFEEAKPELIKSEKEKHEQRIRRDYLSNLTSYNVEMTEEALREMIRRRFGEDVLVPETEGGKTE